MINEIVSNIKKACVKSHGYTWSYTPCKKNLV
jgi:hypothetical protein